jgi:alcohol dehydrogenase class IV
MSNIQGGQAFIKAVDQLCNDLHIETLEQLGVDKMKFFTSLEKMAEDALKSGSPQNTIKDANKEDIKNIYQALWN